MVLDEPRARLDAADVVGRSGDDVLGHRAVRTDPCRLQARAAAEVAHGCRIEWRPPRTQLVTPAPVAEVVDIEDERPVFDWVSQVSRHVGTLVHRELDRLCRPGMQASPAALRSARDTLDGRAGGARRAARSLCGCVRACDGGDGAHARRRAWPLAARHRRVASAKPHPSWRSAASSTGQILEGVIDRTFLDESGQRWIVDFKTSTHEGGGLDAFLDEEVVRYRPQLERYARLMRAYRPGETVRAALYFPVLRQWREVPVPAGLRRTNCDL